MEHNARRLTIIAFALFIAETWRFQRLFPDASIIVLDTPPSSAPSWVVTVLSRRADPEPAGLLQKSCAEFGRIRGSLSPVDRDALIASLRREDKPIRFYSHVEDVPGFKGIGIPSAALVPANSTALPGLVNLAEANAADPSATLERSPRVIATTPPGNGAFGADFQIHAADRLDFRRWLRLRLNVLSGRVSLLAINQDGASSTALFCCCPRVNRRMSPSHCPLSRASGCCPKGSLTRRQRQRGHL